MTDDRTRSTRPTTVALVGAGGFAGFILDAVRDVPEVQVSAVVDLDRSRARELAARHGADEVTWTEALDDRAVDAVVVASPPSTHSALAIEAIGAGKDVFCEKPLGMTPAEAVAVRDHAARHDRVVVVDHVLRYNPLLRGLRALQDHLDWRPSRFLFENDAADESLPAEHWFWDEAHSGGIFVEHGVHFFDAAAIFLDAPATHVDATSTRRDGWPSPDIVTASLVHGDCLATHTHSFTHAHRAERQLMRIDYGVAEARVHGWIPVSADIDLLTDDAGLDQLLALVATPDFMGPARDGFTPSATVSIDASRRDQTAQGRGTPFRASRRARVAMSLGGAPAKPAVYRASVADALRDLHACRLDRTRRPRSGPETAATAVAIAYAATEADRTGRRVRLEPLPPLPGNDQYPPATTSTPQRRPVPKRT